MRVRLSQDGFLRIPIESISSDIRDTLLSYEDRYFYYHFGVNPISIVRAILFNLTNQNRIGASTLTMQVARMVHRKPRTISNKIVEIFMALQLEYHYTKNEILEIYLNNTPYGGNIEGFASASFAYFNTPIESLSLAQIAYLVSIPKNPNQNRPKRAKDIDRLKRAVLSKMRDIVPLQRYNRAMEESILPHRANLPNKAPHLSGKFRGGQKVVTTIDLRVQEPIQRAIKKRVEVLKRLGIHNGMAVVIDNKTMEIIAYIGSQDFGDKSYSGEVDGIEALISAGSTLKPFVYAKALERGIITPLKKLYDIPLFIDGYKPLNYSEQFLGEVSAREALWLSLNIPAVELDRLLGRESLYSLLKRASIKSLTKPKEYYGSSLVLGGFGIRLRDIAELFASLANGGVYSHSSYLLDTNSTKTRLLTKESSYIISKILADVPRDSFSSSWEYLAGMTKVAFKTGTSANARDMLAVGYTPNYTVAVWYGNFSGKKGKVIDREGRKEHRLTGLMSASPTLLEIFRLLRDSSWFSKPKGVITKRVCQDAIEIGECRESILDDTIVGVEPYTPCGLLRAEVLSSLFDRGVIGSMEELSAHRCYPIWNSYKPLITSPIDGDKIIHNSLLPKEYKKTKLHCYSFETNSSIVWLINGRLPIRAKSSQPIYLYLDSGEYKIECLDQGAKIREINIAIDEV